LFRIAGQIIIFGFLYLLLPFYLSAFYAQGALVLFYFYLAVTTVSVILFKAYSGKKYYFAYQLQTVQEEMNVSGDTLRKEREKHDALQDKILRYRSLKQIVEELNKNLDMDYVAGELTAIAFSQICRSKGTCLLYLVDNSTQRLNLFKAKKEDKKLVIRTKEGDIFDFWVMRQATPLLIEDIGKDFRFDREKLRDRDLRPVGSLASAPFVAENRILGILRLDNPQANFFTQEDLRFLVNLSDLGAVALENSELFLRTQDLAIHDELTGLFTKGYFMERLKEECRRSLRQNASFCLFMLDIDRFKDYNDRFGHSAGDIVLKNMAKTIGEKLSGLSPLISRFGGEEFCVLLPGMEKPRGPGIADSLRKAIEEEKVLLRRQETHVTVSIGVAGFPQDGTGEEDLIRAADQAMYKAKQQGRNKVCPA